ncbi:hypothetical protein Nepgr_001324 [Nepenthes gracilis]|uniref:Uncharacterized protein n=1 Tax=Nepenthes gracilis TaxID=150966 RepID=A0AAD3P5U4_NEPGR|nr:hypothetical protein Nepgr_001324 [Nepenthes gracilis]
MGIKQANFVCILVSFSLVLCKSSSHPSSYHEGFASAEPHAINAGRTISNINSSKNQTGSGSLVDGIRIEGGNGGRGGGKGGPTPSGGSGGNGKSTPSSDDSRHAAGAANIHHHLGSSSRSQSHRRLGLAAAILVTLLFGHE